MAEILMTNLLIKLFPWTMCWFLAVAFFLSSILHWSWCAFEISSCMAKLLMCFPLSIPIHVDLTRSSKSSTRSSRHSVSSQHSNGSRHSNSSRGSREKYLMIDGPHGKTPTVVVHQKYQLHSHCSGSPDTPISLWWLISLTHMHQFLFCFSTKSSF